MKKGRFVFSLIGINIEKVDQKYEIDNITSTADDENIPQNTTKIDDLEVCRKKIETLTFLDETKKVRKCTISMVDFSTNKSLENKGYKCFWDKNTIPDNVQAIGCPIKYIPNKAVKTYHSEISKESYTISENVTSKRSRILEDESQNTKIIHNNYYQTDGLFCSLNCCLAYIEDNKWNPMFRHSPVLLMNLAKELNEGEETEIIPAPHWRLLEDFGGKLNIIKFREGFNKIKFIDHGMYFAPIGRLYEDQIKF